MLTADSWVAAEQDLVFSQAAAKRRIGGVWRRSRIPKWRATVDEDGQYSFAVAL
jgi:hypothetical protein